MNFTILRVLLVINSIQLSVMNRSCTVNDFPSHKFKLLKRQAKSEDYILTRKKIPTLQECLELAIAKKGLALNFSRISRKKHSSRGSVNRFNCQILGCPDTNSLDLLVEDERFNYYSAYSRRIIGNETAACLPSIGLFVTIMKPQNWTNAQLECQKIRGKLANVISFERTEGLSKFIFKETPVFVGLSNRGKGRYWRNEYDTRYLTNSFRTFTSHGQALSPLRYRIRSFVLIKVASHWH